MENLRTLHLYAHRQFHWASETFWAWLDDYYDDRPGQHFKDIDDGDLRLGYRFDELISVRT